MSTVPQPHQFVRPGQVAPDLPAPDNCMICGLSEAAHAARDYMREAEAEDDRLTAVLAAIRDDEEAGYLTAAEAAANRVAALEAHLAKCQALRRRHFGNG